MRFPHFIRIAMADGLRDGGSYFLQLVGSDGEVCTLRLPVQLDARGERIGYGCPSLSYQTGKTSEMLAWADAAALAKMLAPLCDGPIAEGGVQRAKECVALLALSGLLNALPPES